MTRIAALPNLAIGGQRGWAGQIRHSCAVAAQFEGLDARDQHRDRESTPGTPTGTYENVGGLPRDR